MKKILTSLFTALLLISTFAAPFNFSTLLLNQAEAQTTQPSTPTPQVDTVKVDQIKAAAAQQVATANTNLQNAKIVANNAQQARDAYPNLSGTACTTNTNCDNAQRALDSANRQVTLAQGQATQVQTLSDSAINKAQQGDYAGANTDLVAAQAHNNQVNNGNAATQQDVSNAKSSQENVCFGTSYGIPFINWWICVKQVVAGVAYIILTLCGYILGLCALILNQILTYTVLNMAEFIKGAPSITTAWTVFRDLANMIFIFALLYITVLIILGRLTGATKNTLIKIIIIGLLINFSLFFTKAAIDASNIVTLGFYRALAVDQNTQYACEKFAGVQCKGFGGKIMNSVGLATIYGGMGLDPSKASAQTGYDKIFLIAIGGSVFMLITAFTFLTIAWLFVLRFVVLIVLLVLSPIAFVAWTLPATQATAKKWWDTLMGQLIFAPLFMALFWVLFILLDNLKKMTGASGGFSDALNVDSVGSNTGIVINFILVIVFIHVATNVAKSYATQGAAIVGTVGKWGTDRITSYSKRAAGGATAGATAAALRNTVGKRALTTLKSNEEQWRKDALSANAITRKTAEAKLATAEKLAKASFDARNTKTGEKFGLNTNTGVGGYKAVLETRKKQGENDILSVGKASDETLQNITNSKEAIKKAKSDYTEVVANGVTDPVELKKRTDAIKEAETKLKSYERAKAREIEEEQKKYAAQLATPGRFNVRFRSTVEGHKQAAQDFLDKTRSKKLNQEEKLAAAEDKLRDKLVKGEEIKAEDVQKIEQNLLKDLPSDLLLNPKINKYFDKQDILAITKNQKISKETRDKLINLNNPTAQQTNQTANAAPAAAPQPAPTQTAANNPQPAPQTPPSNNFVG